MPKTLFLNEGTMDIYQIKVFLTHGNFVKIP